MRTLAPSGVTTLIAFSGFWRSISAFSGTASPSATAARFLGHRLAVRSGRSALSASGPNRKLLPVSACSSRPRNSLPSACSEKL